MVEGEGDIDKVQSVVAVAVAVDFQCFVRTPGANTDNELSVYFLDSHFSSGTFT
ncbi:hypothetical protein STEG23_022549, partial [Scotinomys teguina]